MKHFVSVLLCAAMCTLLTVAAWGITPALTCDTSNIPLMIALLALAIIAIVVVLILMNKNKRK